MDWFIQKIEITNFKYAHDKFSVELSNNNKRKNLLLYGENGCGKSSIYWALYTLYQSYFKEKPDDVKKYFDNTNHQNLLNRHEPAAGSSLIHVYYVNNVGATKDLKVSFTETALVRSGDNFVQNTATSSDFINYKALSSFFDFRNSMATDIFPFIEKEIMPLLDLTDKCHHIMDEDDTVTSYAGEWWSYLMSVPPTLPKKEDGWIDKDSEPYHKFTDAIADFNSRLETQLHALESDTSYMLDDKFGINDIEIKFDFNGAEFNKVWAEHPALSDEKLHAPQILIKAVVNKATIISANNKQISHPKTFFNEAQLTKIAIAMRLALFERRSNYSLPDSNALLCVDDMLISLDMANRLKVIEILLDYARNYQVIVMTHDKAFYKLFQLEIDGANKRSEWTYKQMYIPVTGAIPQPKILDEQDNMQKAEFHICNYDFAAAANCLRKECESVLQRLYMRNEFLKPEKSNGTREKKELEKLVKDLPTFYQQYNLPPGLTPHLNSYRKAILNPMSHADLDTPFFYNELLACKSEIEILRTMTKYILREAEINNAEPFVIEVNNGVSVQRVEYVFIESMAKINYSAQDYYRNSKVRIVAVTPPIAGYAAGDIKPLKEIFDAACAAVGLAVGAEPPINTAIKVKSTGAPLD